MNPPDLDNYLKNTYYLESNNTLYVDPLNTRNAYNVDVSNNSISLEEINDITIWYIKECIDGVVCGYAFTFLNGGVVPSSINYLFGSINYHSKLVSLMFKNQSGSHIEIGTGTIQQTKSNKILFTMQTNNSVDSLGDRIGFVHSSYMIKYNSNKVDNHFKHLINFCQNFVSNPNLV
jgi:hypothetical protein